MSDAASGIASLVLCLIVFCHSFCRILAHQKQLGSIEASEIVPATTRKHREPHGS